MFVLERAGRRRDVDGLRRDPFEFPEPKGPVIERRRQPEAGSYTNTLFRGGDNRILKKIGEESAEFVMACKDDDANAVSGEAADVLYHMLVALAHHGVSWRQVLLKLAQRRHQRRPG